MPGGEHPIDVYITQLARRLHLPAAERDQVLTEVRGHLEERAGALHETEVSEEHAEHHGRTLRLACRGTSLHRARARHFFNTLGPFRDAVAGRTPLPPASQLLGCKLLEVDPERATIKVEFQARPESFRPGRRL